MFIINYIAMTYEYWFKSGVTEPSPERSFAEAQPHTGAQMTNFLLSLLVAVCLVAQAAAADAPVALERSRELLGFGEQVALNFPGEVAVDRKTHIVSLTASNTEFAASIDMTGDTRPVFRRGKAIAIKAEVLDGDGLGVAVCFIDAAGMEFGTGNIPLKPGANVLNWQVPAKVGHHWGAPSDGTITGECRITRVILIRWPNNAPAKVRLDGIDVTEHFSLSDLVDVALKPDLPLTAVEPGSKEAFFQLSSSHDAEAKLSWSLTITADDGQQVQDERQLAIPAKGTIRVPVPAKLTQRHGLLRCDWKLADAGGERSGQLRLAVMRIAGPDKRFRDHFMFGCGGPDHKERNAKLLQQVGIDVVRLSDDWTYSSSAPGVYDWSKPKKELGLVTEHGMEVVWLTAYCPGWAAVEGSKPGWQGWLGARPPRPEPWREYMRQLAQAVKGKVRFYEIWNEADWGFFYSGNTEQYLEMLKIAHDEVKKADPANKVLSSGMAGDCGNFEFQDRVAKEGKNYFDYYGWHQHGSFEQHFQPSVDGRVKRFTEASGKQVFYTETSEQSGHDWSGLVFQGEQVVKKIVHAWARGARAYQWFILTDGDETWGLLGRNYEPKPAYLAHNTLVRTLRGLRPQRLLDLGTDRWAYVFADTSGKRQVVVHWRENAKLPEADFRLAVGSGATVSVVDLYGNATPEPQVAGQIRLRPRTTPVFVVIDGAPAITAALPLVVPQPVGGIAPGVPFILASMVGNPGDRERNLSLKLALPAELRLPAPAVQSMALGKDVQASHRANLTVPSTTALPFGVLQGTLAYDLPGAWSGTLTVPLESVRLIAAGPIGDRNPDFVLASKTDVINQYDNDPIAKTRHWQGPNDLSARVWIACHDGALRLRVVVKDDHPDNPHAGGSDSWNGDSVQITFEAPGRPGNWEAGVWENGGQAKRHIFQAIEGLPNPWEKIAVQTSRHDGGITYDIAFPLADFGLTDEALAKGIHLNLIVNDSDGEGRRQYARIAPGIADSKTMIYAPMVRFAR